MRAMSFEPRASSVRLTRDQLRALDRLAAEEYGLPSAVLMENAGRGASEHVLAALSADVREGALAPGTDSRGARDARVAIVCGPGNNGGDGAVVARWLANAGVAVDVLATHALDALRGDAALERRVIERMRIPVHELAGDDAVERARHVLARADLVVDALLGTGFEGEVRANIARAIELVNAWRASRLARGGAGARVVALDLPSGLDCDTGAPARPTVIADLTVTFAAWKIGFDAEPARAVLGRVVVASIGTPLELLVRVRGA
jgi:NAD(P)H-hydrate epimerase